MTEWRPWNGDIDELGVAMSNSRKFSGVVSPSLK